MDALIGLYCVQANQLGQPGTLKRIFELLDEQGFQVSDIEAVDEEDIDSTMGFGTDIDAAIRHSQMTKGLLFRAKHHKNRLSLSGYADWGAGDKQPSLWVFDEYDLLFSGDARHDVDRVALLKSFVNLAKELYGIVRPFFALISPFAAEVAPGAQDLAALRLPELLWANFFSPVFVKKIGRRRLEAVPLGYTEELSDGGVLYIIDEDVLGDHAHDRYRNRMKSYFGL